MKTCENSSTSFNYMSNLPSENAPGLSRFSYQNLSPTFRFRNWLATMHVKVGPRIPSLTANSDTPPTKRSISSTFPGLK